MKRVCGLLLVLMAAVAPDVSAQTSVSKFLFLGPGVACCDGGGGSLHLGGGVEARLRDRVGIGGELGYLSAADGTGGFGTWSANASYYFGNPAGRLRPFGTGGYTMFFVSNGSASLWNAGGGVEYAVGRRMALRLEARDQIMPGGVSHYVNGRVGIVIR